MWSPLTMKTGIRFKKHIMSTVLNTGRKKLIMKTETCPAKQRITEISWTESKHRMTSTVSKQKKTCIKTGKKLVLPTSILPEF